VPIDPLCEAKAPVDKPGSRHNRQAFREQKPRLLHACGNQQVGLACGKAAGLSANYHLGRVGAGGSIESTMRSPETTSWHSASWQTKPAQQQPVYADPQALERAVAHLSRLPPIVVSWEIEALRERLAAAQRGQAFLLQGGDCAETFPECESDLIAKKLKILLQMSIVLLHGLKKPIIRVGRMAGQYAKPRSTDTETRNGVTLPAYRGDLVNHPEFTAEARASDPELLLRGYERAALTLNFVRALVDGGFADLHHPEYWDLGCVPADREFDRRCVGLLRGHQRPLGARGAAGQLLRESRGIAPVV
jgi:3-deoxy-D-arabino-heptulosonate 7-phosphate (DAHP) synthase class II